VDGLDDEDGIWLVFDDGSGVAGFPWLLLSLPWMGELLGSLEGASEGATGVGRLSVWSLSVSGLPSARPPTTLDVEVCLYSVMMTALTTPIVAAMNKTAIANNTNRSVRHLCLSFRGIDTSSRFSNPSLLLSSSSKPSAELLSELPDVFLDLEPCEERGPVYFSFGFEETSESKEYSSLTGVSGVTVQVNGWMKRSKTLP
jgi:hypothetical protein